GVAAVAMAPQTVCADQLGEGGLAGGAGPYALPEGLRLGLGTARRHHLIVRTQAQAAPALARRALRAQGADRADGRGELDVDGRAAVRLDRDAPLDGGVALGTDRLVRLTV